MATIKMKNSKTVNKSKEKPRSKKNPLREKMQSATNTDKRKVRREFFSKDSKDSKTISRDKRERNRDDNRTSTNEKTRLRKSPLREKRQFRDSDNTIDKGINKSTEKRKTRRDFPSTDRKDIRTNFGDRQKRFKSDNKTSFGDNSKKFKRERSRDNNREDFNEREKVLKPRRERQSTTLDSDIIRDIVKKRRDTGRTKRTPKVLSLAWSEERGAIRLNKYISNSGICSRREADDLITAGAILVNGKIVTELGTKVMPTDEVRYEDKILQREKTVYILLNKPKDYITTTDDEKSRDNVMMLIEGACPQRVYPVGRLDRMTTGLLLFTNDGEMTKKLTHPRYGVKKIYQVELDKNMSLADFELLANGIELEDGLMKPDELEFVEAQKSVLGITLHSGKNRIVRRLFGHLGYEVEKLDRVYYAGLTKKNLPRGEWRFLQQEEVNMLKMST